MAEGGHSSDGLSQEMKQPPDRTMSVKHGKQKSLPADPDMLSRREKEQKLNRFLKKRSTSRRDQPVTRQKVNMEYRKILEQFLQRQLENQDIQTKPQPGRYQRVVEVDIKERTSPSDSQESLGKLPTIFVRGDSIPYADETDEEVDNVKISSVPFDYFASSSDGKLDIHHEKSHSAPHSSLDLNESGGFHISRKNKSLPGGVPPHPPPPPPCTPHSEVEDSEIRRSSPVPFAKHVDIGADSIEIPCGGDKASSSSPDNVPSSKPSPPSTLDLNSHAKENVPSKTPLSESDLTSNSRSSSSPSKDKSYFYLNRRQDRMSGSLSSGESATSLDRFEGRKKKSLFKKARERIGHFLKFKKESSEGSPPASEAQAGRHDVARPKKLKKRPRKESDKIHGDEEDMPMYEDEADVYSRGTLSSSSVLEERHIHTKRQIHQHHSEEDGSKILRVEETDQVIETDRGKERKHTEKHWTVKESRDDSSIIGKIRRMTTKGHKKKKTGMKVSKSDHFKDDSERHPVFSRTISVPSRGGKGNVKHKQQVIAGNDNSFDVADVWRQSTGNLEEINVTHVVSKPDDELKRHSSCLDIIDADGSILKRLWYDNPGTLPKNQSFEFKGDTYVHERKVVKNGQVNTERDVDTHQHFNITEDEDVEVDGIAHENATKKDEGEDLTEQELEEMYEKIAERLAMIGDNYMTRKEEEEASLQAQQPPSNVSGDNAGVGDVMKKSKLNPLEQEISDCLHKVARDIDEKLSDPARKAALELAGQVTYSQFKNVVQEAVGNEIGGLQQVGALMHVTNRAIQLAGAGGALALQIKDMSLRYFEDKFAGWIVEKGGFETILSETEDELDPQ